VACIVDPSMAYGREILWGVARYLQESGVIVQRTGFSHVEYLCAAPEAGAALGAGDCQ
jgi:hypothetical protein